MNNIWLKYLAAKGDMVQIQPGPSIKSEDVLKALNPFYQTSQVDDAFSFLMLIIRLLLTFGGIISIGFIILGGYQYITSGGSPEATKKATTTISWAVVGVIIAFTAALLIDWLIRQLGIEVPQPTS